MSESLTSSKPKIQNGQRNTSRTSKRTAEREEPRLSLSSAMGALTKVFSIMEDSGGEMEVETEGDTVIIKIHQAQFADGVILPLTPKPQTDTNHQD